MRNRTLLALSSLFAAVAAPLSCSEDTAAHASMATEPLEPGTSPWGPDDEIGAANHLNAELARNAAKNGIYVLENIRTAELAKDKAYQFLFVLGHPKYTGTTQSIINPVAVR